MSRKKIKIVYTGGTITGVEKLNSKTIGNNLEPKVHKSEPEVFMDHLIKNKDLHKDFPHLEEEIDLSYSVPINKFSEELTPNDRIKISKEVFKAINEGNDGIIIIHGTDTLTYTSSAISFSVRGIDIPVVLTGSNHPLTLPETDAIRNFSDALFVATNEETSDCFKGVFVIFSGKKDELSTIHLGVRVRKVRYFDNSFKSWNCLPIGIIRRKGYKKRYIKFLNKPLLDQVRLKNEKAGKELFDKINTDIGVFKICDFFDPMNIERAINKGVFGIILELYNSGTAPTIDPLYSILKSLSLAREKHIPVFAASQHEGTVEMDQYGSSINLRNTGVVPLKDMEIGAASWKLAVVGGQTEKYRGKPEVRCEKIKEIMLKNIVGEIEE